MACLFAQAREVDGEGVLEDGTIRSQGAGRVSYADELGTAVECTSGDHSVALTPR